MKKIKSSTNHPFSLFFSIIDKEPEVRSAACGALGDISPHAASGILFDNWVQPTRSVDVLFCKQG